MTTSSGKLRLSPSSLNVFLDCPRCFWLEYRAERPRPRGPFPSLPSGMDIVIKKYFDRYRAVGKLPPEIDGQVKGKLFADSEILNRWRGWKGGLSFYEKSLDAVMVGALDDCIVNEDGYIPVDYKTRGFELKEGGEGFYKNQLNCYSLLLEENNLPQPGYAYLIYFIPKELQPGGQVNFTVEVKEVKTSADDARKAFRDAVKTIERDIPDIGSACQFCAWQNRALQTA
ncbi:MAG: PD-(D/E)XK nuclease family protein [Patescibacteria group bacterium]